jgi:hypothetical protein
LGPKMPCLPLPAPNHPRRWSHIHQCTRRHRCCASWAVDVSTGIERAGAGDSKVWEGSEVSQEVVCAVQGEVCEGEGDEDKDE